MSLRYLKLTTLFDFHLKYVHRLRCKCHTNEHSVCFILLKENYFFPISHWYFCIYLLVSIIKFSVFISTLLYIYRLLFIYHYYLAIRIMKIIIITAVNYQIPPLFSKIPLCQWLCWVLSGWFLLWLQLESKHQGCAIIFP